MNKWTISLWLKRAKIGVEQVIASVYENSNYQTQIKFETDDQLYFNDENNGNTNGRIVSNAKYRDTNGFYHMVFIWDKDNSTSGDKLRMYVNGERITSFSDTGNAPSTSSTWNAANTTQQFGAKATSDYFDGVMSHIHFCDGYAYEPTEFGETDSTTGEWKIKTSPSVSYGTNGYFWLKDNVATTDNSPNSNTFTASGTLTKTEDCPSNVFATLNPLVLIGSVSFTKGNLKFSKTTGSYWRSGFSTLGMTTGKYYFEVLSNAGSDNFVGARDVETCDGNLAGNNDHLANVTAGYGLYSADGKVKGNSNSDLTGVIGTYTNGDYIGCFLDLDNNKLYFSKNGTMLNTTGVDIASGKTYLFGVSGYTSGARLSCNFGNGVFDETQLTGTTYNGSDGNGIFKYDPNNITLDGSSKSFKSLSTKGLNS